MASKFNYSISDFEGIKVFDLTGNIDNKTIDLLDAAVSDSIGYENIILNLESVNIITTSGLIKLVELSRLARNTNKRVIILSPSNEFIKMIESFKLFNYLILAYSPEEAQKKIKYYT